MKKCLLIMLIYLPSLAQVSPSFQIGFRAGRLYPKAEEGGSGMFPELTESLSEVVRDDFADENQFSPIQDYGRPFVEPDGHFPAYHRYLFQKTKDVFSAPFYWSKRDWLGLGGMLLSVAAVSTVDDNVKSYSVENGNTSSHNFSKKIGTLGEEGSWAVLGGFFISGIVFKSDRASAVVRDGFASSIIASGLLTPFLKMAAGRSRPREEQGSGNFKPFGGDYSFPSGHTTQAFAIAGVISAHYPNPWARYGSYGLATLVGLSRIESNSHFASDVLAGALIGTWVAKKVTGTTRRGRYQWEPLMTPNQLGVKLKIQDKKQLAKF